MALMDLLLSSSLFVIMIGIGLSIKLSDLIVAIKQPKELIFGVLIQIILFPLITFLIIKNAPINDLWKVGFMILAACPSGVLSNLLTSIFKGKAALSIETTAANNFLSLITLPIYSSFAITHFLGDYVPISLPFGELALYLFTITLVPAIVGAIIENRNKKLANKISKPLRKIGTVLFFIVVVIKFFVGGDSEPIPFNHIKEILPWAIIINIITVLLGYSIARGLRFSKRAGITFASEMGIQNTTFALILTETILNHPTFGSPALVYVVSSFPLTWGLNWFIKKYL
jgi:BASS family bile acid:Na+ symporter